MEMLCFLLPFSCIATHFSCLTFLPKNIAYKKLSRHDSTTHPPHYSDEANDGNLATCSYTRVKNTVGPWWNLWLSEYTTFKKLEFVTVDSHLSHFRDFEVTVYNTTELNFKWKGPVSGGQVCYNHNYSKPQSTKIHITCNGSPVGNLIRVQLQSKGFQLVLCDFRVYGDCYNGFYGNDCQKCSDNCESTLHRYCDSKTGHCLKDCKPGWKGDRCETKCDNGFFGKGCYTRCNNNCLPSQRKELCDNVNGTCLNGCKAGYQGSQCSNKCETGKWGQDCRGNCGNCVSSACDHITGECPRGCSAGYKPPNCDTECDNGSYGKDCQNRCNRNCLRSGVNAICDNVNGTCLNGCKAGYRGSRCDIKCDDGKWGRNCTNDCGKCLTSPCNHVNGYCQDGCAAGYKKTWDCHSECEDGTYGNSCLFNCSDNCKGICNKINGTCDQCLQFWTGHFCEKVSDRILSDREELTRCQETSKLNIVFICVGILWVILAVYATVITILFKRKATQNEKEETSGSFSGRTKDDAYVNETNKTESVTYEQATEATSELARVHINATDDESHQYTDLTPDTKDVEATYETIQLE